MNPELATVESELVSALLHTHRDEPPEPSTTAAAKAVVLDSVAVGLGTRDHPAARVARAHVARHMAGSDVGVWGSGQNAGVEGAILANTVPLRCYDFNDVLHGRTGQAGHPSDFVPGLMALAEKRGCSGRVLLDAVIAAYDATRVLFDLTNVTARGWDYTNLTGLGAVAGFARMLGLDDAQGMHALGIFASSHLATNQLESGDLSSTGNLTMWKRFNGADAVLGALRACLLSASGLESPTHSLLGDNGFFRQLGAQPGQVAQALPDVLADPRRGVELNEFKRWPVGTRAQSAIEAALQCRLQLPPDATVDAVQVEAEEAVVRHLVRAEAWEPHSRETADHSLPFAVALALAEGDVAIEHYETDEFFHAPPVRDLLSKVTVEPRPDPDGGARSSYPTRVTVESGGKSYVADAEYPPERIRAATFTAELDEKFTTLAGRHHQEDDVRAIQDLLRRLEHLDDLKVLGAALTATSSDLGG